jgi:hypothetical protein
MKRKMYDYIISYTYEKDGYLGWCTGMSGISRAKKINNFHELDSTRNLIQNSIEGAKNLAIQNIVLLGRNRHE